MPIYISSTSPVLISKTTVVPDPSSRMEDLKLSVSDLPMLSVHYIQKGCLYGRTSLPVNCVVSSLKAGLSRTLACFPPLAGRFTTDSDGHVYIASNDAGAEFIHATARGIFVEDVLSPTDVPDFVKEFFAFDLTVSYAGHVRPLAAVQVTELADGVFVGCTVNHAVVDGTSFWNFFNTFAEICKGARMIYTPGDFMRDSILLSSAVLKLPPDGPKPSFSARTPLRERIFSFTRESITHLKARANYECSAHNGEELKRVQISSFQSLCALLWRAVTRARKHPQSKTTTFRMAVNCRPRLKPQLQSRYFGNAIQSVPTSASVGDVVSRDVGWTARKLNGGVAGWDNAAVRRAVQDWEREPRCFPLGNLDGAMVTMGSSPRFPMYDPDFGWGRPLAVRSGGANKFDGKMSAFPGRADDGSVDVEVCLRPETMAALERDPEFVHYASI